MLQHLTLNTGHLESTSRSDVDQQVIDWLLPLIDGAGGPLPRLEGWHLAVLAYRDEPGPRLDGSLCWQIADEPGLSRRPISMAMACWTPEALDVSWRAIRFAYEQFRPSLTAQGVWREPEPTPPALPWLAAFRTPFFPALADADVKRAIRDLNRCVAWAAITA